ncbi:protein-tyrosine phosphatase [Malaciobacter marinus]|jgi:protein-tyrosine phosphatase|uniref:protein-tyrosine-phosphatase n=1 Tax=Malaciobacter marinus TaxID=505249 RepID=A0AB36ZZ89_9BACT|nr:low molecular weight protein-tyrosine-phosphatase [Malaciobacter marinus]PPK62725.1 protein-tyrosine phosphatase [Malaciobacter marinus]SKB73791.1 protein-tyrosine phosphatase [Malaciobacter marinus]
MSKIKSIIFVCLGNICRSPIAQGIAQKYIKDNQLDIKVDSAGTGSWHIGESPCEHSINIAKQNGIDISRQIARQVNLEDFQTYDLVVGLDERNMQDLEKLGCKDAVKLGDFGFDGQDVPDPFFFEGFEGFDKVYSMIEKCVIELIKQKS